MSKTDDRRGVDGGRTPLGQRKLAAAAGHRAGISSDDPDCPITENRLSVEAMEALGARAQARTDDTMTFHHDS